MVHEVRVSSFDWNMVVRCFIDDIYKQVAENLVCRKTLPTPLNWFRLKSQMIMIDQSVGVLEINGCYY